jgi:hypothetical protein
MRIDKTLRIRAGLTGVMLLLAAVAGLEAHHSLTLFDTTTPVTVSGTVVRFESGNPHSYLYVEQQSMHGQSEQWAVEGPGALALSRLGLDRFMFQAGDPVEACGYVLKGAPQDPDRPILLVAEILTPVDGETRLWSDYGNRHCREQSGIELSR